MGEMEFESEEDYWNQAFETFDANSDGGIDLAELEHLMQVCKLNPTREQVEEIMNEFSQDGRMNKQQFMSMMKTKQEEDAWPDPYEDLLTAFALFDSENTGELTLDQMIEIMQYGKDALKPEELQMFEEDFRLCDKDGSGTINIKEFVEFLTRMGKMFFEVEYDTVEVES